MQSLLWTDGWIDAVFQETSTAPGAEPGRMPRHAHKSVCARASGFARPHQRICANKCVCAHAS
eukprot:366217-Chlamydomonas_euryale.AAC.4